MRFGGPFLLSLVFTVQIADVIGDVQEECHAKMDIVTLLDGSKSVGRTDFGKQKEAVFSLVKNLNLDPEGQRVAAVVYSSKVHDVIEFSADVQSLVSKISDISYPKGSTNTHLGIREMKSMFDRKGRNEIKKIGIVITDGKSNNKSETRKAAAESKDSGITMFAIGVGRNVDVEELRDIASSESHVLEAANFDALESHLQSILEANCKVDGGWTDWKTTKTGTCSATCGEGSKSVTRTRTCTNPTPKYGGKECEGPETRQSDEACGSENCPVDGGWSDWETITGPCSATCGGGSQSVTQTRTCTNPEPAYGGKACEGHETRQSDEACGSQNCPVDGGWTDWKTTKTGTCSATCGEGSKSVTRTRTCTNPTPEYGGKECEGPETRQSDEACGSENCPVDGGWSDWETITGPCSATCGGGSQPVTQTRTCTNPEPEYGGKECEGQETRQSDEACGGQNCPETQTCFEGCKSLPQRRPSAKLLGLKRKLRLEKNALSAHRRKKMSVVGGHSYREMFIAVFVVLWFPVLFLVVWDLKDLMMFILSAVC